MKNQESPKRKKRGPKPKIKNSRRCTSYLPEETYEYLCMIGGGVFSHGVRIAGIVYDKNHGDELLPDLLANM